MSGFVDLHLHLLPGVDDGCKTLDDSLALARALVALGFEVAAPSPHNRPEYPSRSAALCREKRAVVAERLALEQVPLALEENAENYFLDEVLLSTVATPEARRLGPSRACLLVEAPYSAVLPMLNDVVFRMKLKGVTPLIAHPERCLEFHRRGRARELVQAGALLQLDMGALIGRYGDMAEKVARGLLADGLYAVAATDAHGPANVEAWVGQSLEALHQAVGPTAFAALVRETPAALLRGEIPDEG